MQNYFHSVLLSISVLLSNLTIVLRMGHNLINYIRVTQLCLSLVPAQERIDIIFTSPPPPKLLAIQLTQVGYDHRINNLSLLSLWL